MTKKKIDIPKDWKFTKLGSLGQFLKGKGIAKSEVIEDGIPCVRYGEIYTNHNDYIKAFTSFTNQDSANQSTKLEYGDILFAGSGETLEDIGKSVAFVDEFEAYAGGDIIILRGHNQDPKFVGFLLNTDFVSRQTFQLGQGHSVVHIYSSGLKNVKIPLPPLPEQQKIATILSTWDKAIDKLTQLIAAKEQHKKGLMQQLLTGKKRFAGYIDNWKEKEIQSFGMVIRGASPRPKGDPRYYGGKVPRLMVEDVTRDGKYVIPRVDFLTEEGALKSRPCPAGTLTIVCSGDVGTPSILGVDACIHDGFLAITNLKSSIIVKDFLYYQMFRLKERMERSATHGGVFTNLTTTILKEFRLQIPSIEEQQKIASVLSAADKEIELLNNELERLQQQKKGLMQVLLTGEVRVKI